MLPLQTSYPTLVGLSLREIREQKNTPQAELARALTISPQAMSRIEKGDTAITSEQTCLAAVAFGIRPASIFQRADQMAEELSKSDWVIKPSRIKGEGVDLLQKGLKTGLTLPTSTIGALAAGTVAGGFAALVSTPWIGAIAFLAGEVALAYKDKSKSNSADKSVFLTAIAGAEALRGMGKS